MLFKLGRDELKPYMTTNPNVFISSLAEMGYSDVKFPPVPRDFFDQLWADGKSASRLKTWGHLDGPLSAHYLATRGGTPLHTDPAYPRYSVQVQIYNEGWFTHGCDETIPQPRFKPGLVTILDTHSPHKVSKDLRVFYVGPNKMVGAIDSVEMPDVPSCVAQIVERLRQGLVLPEGLVA